LWRIASRVVGAKASDSQIEREVVAIWNANAARIGTGDPNLIFPGQRLHLPQAEA
jgi:nucleoid-associated protein YgaU